VWRPSGAVFITQLSQYLVIVKVFQDFVASMFILKRNPDARYTESYNVLFEGRHVGRIYKAVSHAPREAPWFWGLEFHEWQGSDGPQYGNVATLEAAKQAFRAAWDRRPKASSP
jgi:hypothetical protein